MDAYYAGWLASKYMDDPLFWVFAVFWSVPSVFVVVVGGVGGIVYLIQAAVCALAGLTVLNDWAPIWAIMGKALIIDIVVVSAGLMVLEIRARRKERGQ